MKRDRIDIHIQPYDDGYSATYNGEWVTDEIWFAGHGKNHNEAVGNFITSNRENLNITFKITDKDGGTKYSTVYGIPRTQEEI